MLVCVGKIKIRSVRVGRIMGNWYLVGMCNVEEHCIYLFGTVEYVSLCVTQCWGV